MRNTKTIALEKIKSLRLIWSSAVWSNQDPSGPKSQTIIYLFYTNVNVSYFFLYFFIFSVLWLSNRIAEKKKTNLTKSEKISQKYLRKNQKKQQQKNCIDSVDWTKNVRGMCEY